MFSAIPSTGGPESGGKTAGARDPPEEQAGDALSGLLGYCQLESLLRGAFFLGFSKAGAGLSALSPLATLGIFLTDGLCGEKREPVLQQTPFVRL